MRADRLLSILLLLQNHGRMTSRELAEKLEVSERTIHRDMESLSASGVPVFAERGASGGWVLSEGYQTNLTGMKTEEILSLLLSNSSSIVSDLGMQSSFDAAFQKLLAASPVTLQRDAQYVRERIHIDGAGWHQANESIPYLPIVQEAVWEECIISIRYQRHESTVGRIIQPLGMVAKRSTWYLVAKVGDDIRTYRVSRLLDVQMLDEKFVRPANFDLADYWEQSTNHFKSTLPSYPARIKLQEKMLSRLRTERYVKVLHTSSVTLGWLECDVEFETLESACEIALSFGPLVKVIEPTELRDNIVVGAKAILTLYDSV